MSEEISGSSLKKLVENENKRSEKAGRCVLMIENEYVCILRR
jgi:hypothetical protein